MVEKWVGKNAIVTGFASGIGAAVYKEFVKNKINVIGLDVNQEKIEKVQENFPESSGSVFAFYCDIANPESVKSTFRKIEDQFGVVHLLINCAGIGRKAEILDDNDESFDRMNQVIDVNVRGLLQCTREAFKLMKKSDDYGLIININSIAGHKIPFLDMSLNIYGSTKHAVTALNETVRHELIRANNMKIRTSSLSPGIVDSDFIRASGYAANTNDSFFAEMPKLKPESVASGVMFILSTPYDVNVCELTIRSTGERE